MMSLFCIYIISVGSCLYTRLLLVLFLYPPLTFLFFVLRLWLAGFTLLL